MTERQRQPATESADAAGPANGRKIEVGIIASSGLDADDLERIELARSRLQQDLSVRFPGFDWQFPFRTIPETGLTAPAEPSQLLRIAADQRDAEHWDFALLVTPADLVGHYRPFTLSALSRPLDAAVLSLARLDASGADTDPPVAARLATCR